MILRFADTSAVLYGFHETAAISPITVQELEHIKNSDRNEQIKFKARQAVHAILNGQYEVTISNNHKIDRILKKYPFLSAIPDHYILCTAENAAIEQNFSIDFITNDSLQFLFAQKLPHLNPIYLENKTPPEWKGWRNIYPNDWDMAALYNTPEINTFNCPTNEFIKVYSNGDVKDILFWDGKTYRPLKYKDMKNPYIQETIKPKNLEQKMAFDLLQNQNIKVKLLTSSWGSGKTLMALTYALEKVHHGDYQKLVFVRNNIIVADTNDIGFLPGDLRDKMSIWGAPLADHLGGQDMLDSLIDQGIIEVYPLSHMRGRSINNSIVICDECENMNDKLVTLLMSRIEEDSELIFCGDVAQIDNRKFEKNNGICSMLEHLSGEPLFGTVKLVKSERGPVAQMCDKIIPPR